MTLRKGVLLLPLILSAFFSSAETYVLGIDQLKANLADFQPSDKWDSYTGTFTDKSFEWRIDIQTLTAVSSTFKNIEYNGYLWLQADGNINKFSHVILSTANFIGGRISKATIEATMRNQLQQETEQTIVVTLADTVFNTTQPIYHGNLSGDFEPLEVTFGDDIIQDSLAIRFSAPGGADFVLRSITIEYEPIPVPVVSMSDNIPVGHAIELTADLADAAIYYSIDNGEEWQAYDATTGIVFSEPGIYTLNYYGESANGEARSQITTESIEVVQPKGISALQAACSEIEISGVISGHADGYVLVGADQGRSSLESIAVDAAVYTELLTAPVGSRITATGRATDRFGTLPALGSLSALTINDVQSTPTSIVATPSSATPRTAPTYDLQGRRVSPTTTRRQILISNGRLTLPQ